MSNLELNYTMGVIDCKNFTKNIEDPETSEAIKKQLIHADKIIINKIDLVGEEEIKEVETRINSFNPLVEIKHTEYANADLDYLTATPEKIKNFKDRYVEEGSQKENTANSSEVHTHTAHSQDIKPHYIEIEGLLDADKVEVQMGVLHWESEVILMRCKGLYHARDWDGNLNQYLLQGVDDTFEWRDIKELPGDYSDFKNKFLFVGKNINLEELTEQIKDCK